MAPRALALTLMLGLAGCYPRVAPPPGAVTDAQVEAVKLRWPAADKTSLEGGRKLFLDNCDRCHGYPDLNFVVPEDWPWVAEKMGKKAELTPQDTEVLLRWILAARPAHSQAK